jgi:hypothetical protein
MRVLTAVTALLLSTVPCGRAQAVLPTYAAGTANTDVQAWARSTLQGLSLSCVYVANDGGDSRGSALARVDTSTAAGRALRTALQAVRALPALLRELERLPLSATCSKPQTDSLP